MGTDAAEPWAYRAAVVGNSGDAAGERATALNEETCLIERLGRFQ